MRWLYSFDCRMTSHSWHIATHARPTFCNVCREALSGKIDDRHYFYHPRLISFRGTGKKYLCTTVVHLIKEIESHYQGALIIAFKPPRPKIDTKSM